MDKNVFETFKFHYSLIQPVNDARNAIGNDKYIETSKTEHVCFVTVKLIYVYL